MHILAATDFSKPATEATDVAAALAKKLNLPLHLTHCSENWVTMGELAVTEPDDRLSRERLASEAARLRATGIEVVTEFRQGSAGFEVATMATDPATKMLVLGPVTKNTVERLLTGSVAAQTTRSAPVPTMIVRDAPPLLAWLRNESALNVLCGINFTPSADAAVAFIKDLGALGQIDVAAAYISPVLDQVAAEDAKLDFKRDISDRLHTLLGDAPAKIEVRAAMGRPAHELMELAKEQRSGLIVIGTHHRSRWHQMLKTSFPQAVAVHAETNVLCVPASSHAPSAQVPAIHRALVATDFSDRGNEAIRHACGLVGPSGEVRLLHVCFLPTSDLDLAVASEATLDHALVMAQSLKDAYARLMELMPRVLATSGITATSEVLPHHDIATAICDAADRFGADVICMGTTGHSRARIALLGSTVQAVLARSHRPVLVVTQPQSA